MNESPEENKRDEPPTQEEAKQPGFCSAVCTDRASLRNEIRKPELKTSDFFVTCNLPKRFEHPHWFNGYGCQVSKQHPFYRTSANEYGWFPPGYHSVPSVYYAKDQSFTSHKLKFGMYRNYSLNTGMDTARFKMPENFCIHSVPSVFYPAGQTFTNRLAAAGMYRNYSLNTGMDPAGYN